MMVVFGLLAGMLTTVLGMGGGVLLVLALTAWLGDPLAALAVTTPALLVGNLHRFALYRRDLVWKTAGPFVAGALPGSLLGGLLAVSVPVWVVNGMMIGAAAAAVARSMRWWTPKPRGQALLPAGAAIGAVSAAAGAGGFLAGPVLLATGLTGTAYVATSSLAALSMHLGRLVAYGAGGLFHRETLAASLALAVSIPVGNLVGDRLRHHIPAGWGERLETGTAVAIVGLAVTGLVA